MVSSFLGGAAGGVVGRAVLEIVTDSKGAERSLTQFQKRLAVGVVSGFILATTAATQFESSLTRIETLVGISADRIEVMRGRVLGLSAATGRGPRELADALFVVTSAGERGAAALEILEAASKASTAGLGETASIARTVTAAMQAWGPEALSAERATDILVATVREGNLEASSLAGSLGRVLGIAAQVGVSFENVGAFIATFTRLGVSAEESVTALRAVLTTMINPTEGAREALGNVGLTMAELRRVAVEQGLPQALNTLVQAFEGNTEALAQVIPNVRALSGVLGTAGAQGEAFGKILDSIENSAGITNKAFERASETTGVQWERAVASLQVLLISLGSVTLPLVADALGVVASGASGLANLFTSLPEPVQQLVIGFTAVVALGPVVVAAFQHIRTSALGARAAMLLLNSSILLNPWVALAAIVGTGMVIAYRALKSGADEANESLRTQLDLLRSIEDLPLEQAIKNLADAESDLAVATGERARLEREQAARGASDTFEQFLARAEAIDELKEKEGELTKVRNDAREQLDQLNQALSLNIDDQERLVAATKKVVDAYANVNAVLDLTTPLTDGHRDALARAADVTGFEASQIEELAAKLRIPLTEELAELQHQLEIRAGQANETLAGQNLVLGILARTQEQTAGSIDDIGRSAREVVTDLAALTAEALALELVLAARDLGQPGDPLEDIFERESRFGDFLSRLLERAREAVELQGEIAAATELITGRTGLGAALEEIESSGAATVLEQIADALDRLESRQTAEVAEAFVRAFTTGGDPARAVARVRMEQERLNRQWPQVADGLRRLGIEVPELFRDLFDRIAQETERGGQRIEGLLGFLVARRLGAGLDPGGGLISTTARPPEGVAQGLRPQASTMQVTVERMEIGVNPDVPGGIDADAALNVAVEGLRETFGSQ